MNLIYINNLKNHRIALILIFMATVAAWLISYYFKHGLLIDWNSYVSIASKYSKGNFSDAINGYWSPLISWILAIFYSLGFDISLSGQIFFTLCVTINLLSFYFLLNQLAFTKIEKWILVVTSVFGTIYFSFSFKTPDLLSCSMILIYVALCIIYSRNPSIKNGAKIGVIGALCYYAKYFNFPYFVLHFLLLSFILVLSSHPIRKILKSSMAGFAVFAILVLPWVIMLSMKYGHVTFSTSGFFNTAKISPEWRPLKGDIEKIKGFLPPPNSTAFSAWEDPTYYPMKKWAPWDSWENFKFNKANVIDNIKIIKYAINYCSWFAIIILFFAIIEIVKKKKLEEKIFFVIMIASLIIYTMGYVLIAVEERYFIQFYFLLLVAGVIFVKRLGNTGDYSQIIMRFIQLLFLVSFIYMPLTYFSIDREKAAYYDMMYGSTQDFARSLPKEATFSSNEYEIPLFYAMYSNTRFFGCLPVGLEGKEADDALKKHKGEYFMYIGGTIPSYLNDKKLVFEDKRLHMFVYQLK